MVGELCPVIEDEEGVVVLQVDTALKHSIELAGVFNELYLLSGVYLVHFGVETFDGDWVASLKNPISGSLGNILQSEKAFACDKAVTHLGCIYEGHEQNVKFIIYIFEEMVELNINK